MIIKRRLQLVLLLVWISTIFITSNFFIERSDFIRFISKYLPSDIIRREWSDLWMYAGFFLVKLYHVTEYVILYSLLYIVSGTRLSIKPKRKRIICFIACVLFAASDEWHQTFIAGRGGTVSDVCIDSIGIIIAYLYFGTRKNVANKNKGSI